MTISLKSQSQPHPAAVVSVRDAGAGLRVLRVALTDGASFPFLPGQYAELAVAGETPRAFSIASLPGSEIEFHVRDAGHGVSAALFALAPGGLLTVAGPFGDCVLRDTGRPVLALGGGVGVAPLKSMAEAYLQGPSAAPFRLYWGVRDAGQLYLDDYFHDLAAREARFAYAPLVAEGPGARQGLPVPAAIEDLKDLSGHDIYLSGPWAMAQAALEPLLAAGADRARIFSDAFSTASAYTS